MVNKCNGLNVFYALNHIVMTKFIIMPSAVFEMKIV